MLAGSIRQAKAVFGSIGRDGTVVSLSPTNTIMWPPLPRQASARNDKPFLRASSRNSATNRSRLFIADGRLMSYRTKTSERQAVRTSRTRSGNDGPGRGLKIKLEGNGERRVGRAGAQYWSFRKSGANIRL